MQQVSRWENCKGLLPLAPCASISRHGVLHWNRTRNGGQSIIARQIWVQIWLGPTRILKNKLASGQPTEYKHRESQILIVQLNRATAVLIASRQQPPRVCVGWKTSGAARVGFESVVAQALPTEYDEQDASIYFLQSHHANNVDYCGSAVGWPLTIWPSRLEAFRRWLFCCWPLAAVTSTT